MNAMLSSRLSTFDDRVETRGGVEVEVQVDKGSISGEDSPNHDGEPDSAQNVHHVEDIFLKKFIPAREIHPDLHDNLHQLMDHRHSISTAMGLALDDDDMYHYQIYKDLFDQANREMHTVLSKGMQVVNMRSSSDMRARGAYQDAVSNPVTPALSPPASQSVDVQRWRGVDSLRLGDSTPRGGHLKQSYKETDHAFEILLSYQGVVSARMVNENLHNRILHGMAKGYLENEFGFRLNNESDFELEFGGKLLLRLGVIGDIPIYPGSTIIIRYPMKPPISGERLSILGKKDKHFQKFVNIFKMLDSN
jgi:hypothetical protein